MISELLPNEVKMIHIYLNVFYRREKKNISNFIVIKKMENTFMFD